MNRAFFYPAGRESTDAIGALDLALWDIKGKVQGVPVHELLERHRPQLLRVLQHRRHHSRSESGHEHQGSRPAHHRGRLSRFPLRRHGPARQYAPTTPASASTTCATNVRRRAKAWARTATGASTSTSASISRRNPRLQRDRGSGSVFRRRSGPNRSVSAGPSHLAQQSERSVGRGRGVGQSLGLQPLVENHDIDFVRATLPNVGGITEMMKIAAICETHFVGIVPHFTGPIATAALVNSLGTFSAPCSWSTTTRAAPCRTCPSAWISKTANSIPTNGRAWV